MRAVMIPMATLLRAIGQGLPHFSSLSLAGGMAFLGTLHGIVAVSGA